MADRPTTGRQHVLHLWLAAAALDTEVAAWASYGGPASGAPRFDGPDPPYRTGVDAIADGWSLLQAPGPIGIDAANGELGCEFVFERREPIE